MTEDFRPILFNATTKADRERLPMWVLYDRPSDHPDAYVARLHYSLPAPAPTDHHVITADVEALRLVLADLGCTRIARHPMDEAQIMETWIV